MRSGKWVVFSKNSHYEIPQEYLVIQENLIIYACACFFRNVLLYSKKLKISFDNMIRCFIQLREEVPLGLLLSSFSAMCLRIREKQAEGES